jgi:thiol-disulfide isomerase/thioredoxin
MSTMKKSLGLMVLTAFASLVWFLRNPVVPAQDSGLTVMHVPAPDFPPPAGANAVSPAGPGSGSLQGVPPLGPAGRSAGAGSPPATIPSQGSQSSTRSSGVGPGGVTWINGPPLTMAELRGKVVMIDFWEYTCINCIRTFPENKKLWDRYRNDGFVLIGVDDAEFASAAPVEHVREAVKRFQLPYPVVVDYHYQIWNAYKNTVWPNIFLIDANGYIRYNRAGEGDDSEIESAIQGLLKEAHPGLEFPASYTFASDVNPLAPGCGGEPTPEMYVGDWYGRGTLANPEGYHEHKTIDYAQQNSVEDGHVVLAGRWETDKNGMIYRGKHKGDEPSQDHAALRYHAREIYAVMNLARSHASRLYIMQDGKYLTASNKGADVTIDSARRSYIEVREPRMYYLVQNLEFGGHTVELFPTSDGLTIDSFTFGNNCQRNFAHL